MEVVRIGARDVATQTQRHWVSWQGRVGFEGLTILSGADGPICWRFWVVSAKVRCYGICSRPISGNGFQVVHQVPPECTVRLRPRAWRLHQRDVANVP